MRRHLQKWKSVIKQLLCEFRSSLPDLPNGNSHTSCPAAAPSAAASSAVFMVLIPSPQRAPGAFQTTERSEICLTALWGRASWNLVQAIMKLSEKYSNTENTSVTVAAGQHSRNQQPIPEKRQRNWSKREARRVHNFSMWTETVYLQSDRRGSEIRRNPSTCNIQSVFFNHQKKYSPINPSKNPFLKRIRCKFH